MRTKSEAPASSTSASAICATMSALCTRRWTRPPAAPVLFAQRIEQAPARRVERRHETERDARDERDRDRVQQRPHVQRPVDVVRAERIGRRHGVVHPADAVPRERQRQRQPTTNASSTDSVSN